MMKTDNWPEKKVDASQKRESEETVRNSHITTDVPCIYPQR